MEFGTATMTFLLIAINALVSGYALMADPSLLDRWSFRPRRVVEKGEYHRLITGGFLHGSFTHLAFNLITLLFFGPPLESILGGVGFLIVYFGAELTAHALSLVMHAHDPNYAAVGASGAISGVLFGYCLFAPFSMLYIFFAVPMPAIVFAVLYVVFSIYAMRTTAGGTGGGIAHEAHLGGALGGLILTIIVEPQSIPHFLSQIGLG